MSKSDEVEGTGRGQPKPGKPAGATRREAAARPLTVVAFGGNALIEADDIGTQEEQIERAERFARSLVGILEVPHDLVLVHGNGPQVGRVLIQMEEAATKVPPGPVDAAVAQTEGSMGYLLELALRNQIAAAGLEREVSSVLSLVVVDGGDAGFLRPSKPIGPFFSRYRAQTLQRDHHWTMVEDSGRGWRKVVPSPRPLEILALTTVRRLLSCGQVVIAAGGGGIPVVREGDRLRGVEAVIDKDRTSALLARALGARNLLFVTAVDRVYRGFRGPIPVAIDAMTADEAERLLASGEVAVGSMAPKIESALEFVRGGDGRAVVTDLENLVAALAGRAGTSIVDASR